MPRSSHQKKVKQKEGAVRSCNYPSKFWDHHG